MTMQVILGFNNPANVKFSRH